ncbi:MAG: glycerol-3-phosphate acyltransferase, partial [Ardenticatenaceae bacterium]|nr:glycerol-3-phosphate acyltransferase [Ardenticatenaceae bacterium]
DYRPPPTSMTIIWTLLTFLIGALPFSVWIGRYGLKKDITQYGDKNPGATNVLRAGGYAWFALALILDISKGAAPVGLAYYIFGWQDWRIIPITLAAPLGHAYSPFLSWRGGKSIATALGVWIGVTLWQIPLVGVIALSAITPLVAPSGWAVMGALGIILAAILLWQQNPILAGVWLLQTALLAWNHREDLVQRPRLRQRKRRD